MGPNVKILGYKNAFLSYIFTMQYSEILISKLKFPVVEFFDKKIPF